MCQRWRNSGKNASGGVRLEQAVVETTRYGSSLPKESRKRQGTSPPWPSSCVFDRVRALLGQAVRKTPGYGCALARQRRKHQGTGPSWPSSEENSRIRVRLVQAVT
ncbi:hypothetical protein Y032_0388g485 [Ancylostoma ceylanicum]|uniref:Uncharacterized protein n=1 Tax=Ancylostoma ceylanicum TaxID=53326 RepID=A0A016RTB8_9BILA|nr:hypothetical protein Y032_0388g485 [Ancylostoma ceylanicum]